MHVAGMRPLYVDRSAVPGDAVSREVAILEEQVRSDAANAFKSPAVVRKMVEGRLGKWYEDVCLLEQRYVLDDSKRVRDVLAGCAGAGGWVPEPSGSPHRHASCYALALLPWAGPWRCFIAGVPPDARCNLPPPARTHTQVAEGRQPGGGGVQAAANPVRGRTGVC
jgi:hypothetical protein